MMAAMATSRRADMFTADGKPSDDDPRENRPRLGDERGTLVESLRCQRLTLEMKCSGLDAEAMARRSVEPSTMSLLGLVRHLAEMERATFRVLMAGQDVPRLFCSDTDRDGVRSYLKLRMPTFYFSPIEVRKLVQRPHARDPIPICCGQPVGQCCDVGFH